MAAITSINAANNAIQSGNQVLSSGGELSIIPLVLIFGIVIAATVVGYVMTLDF